MKYFKKNKTVVFIKLFLTAILSACVYCLMVFAQSLTLNPGIDRWDIKTSIEKNAVRKTVSIQDLLTLQNPICKEDKAYDKKRIPNEVSPGNLKEGDIVTTIAYIHLVALEDDSQKHQDGDYHIQLSKSETSGDSCFIVEIPFPDFIKNNSALKDSCTKARKYVKDEILKLKKDKEPATKGSLVNPVVEVTVTGQLFFDAHHISKCKTGERGKQGMKSYTAWELHPVISIRKNGKE